MICDLYKYIYIYIHLYIHTQLLLGCGKKLCSLWAIHDWLFPCSPTDNSVLHALKPMCERQFHSAHAPTAATALPRAPLQ